MGSIYELADSVLVWLGMPTDDSEAALAFLNFAESHFGDVSVGARLQSAFKGDLSRLTTAVEELFTRPYWWRLWPVQEIVLARHIVLQCGRERIDWNSLLFWSHNTNSIRAASGDNSSDTKYWPIQRYEVDHLVQERADRAKHGRNAGLLSMINTHSYKRCEDPRDRVYAMLSMIGTTSDGFPLVETIKPDYQKPAEDLIFDLLTHVNIPYGMTWNFLETYLELLDIKWVKEPSLDALESHWQELLTISQKFHIAAYPLGRISRLWQPKWESDMPGCHGFTIPTPRRDINGRDGPANYTGIIRGKARVGDMVYDLGCFGGAGFVVSNRKQLVSDRPNVEPVLFGDMFHVLGSTHLVERVTELQRDTITNSTVIADSLLRTCLHLVDIEHLQVLEVGDEDYPVISFGVSRRDLARLIFGAVHVHEWWVQLNPGNKFRLWEGDRTGTWREQHRQLGMRGNETI